jgi:hypothetical protein
MHEILVEEPWSDDLLLKWVLTALIYSQQLRHIPRSELPVHTKNSSKLRLTKVDNSFSVIMNVWLVYKYHAFFV